MDKYKGSPITEEITQNIISYFLQNKNNTAPAISKALNYKVATVNYVIDIYFKKKTPK